MESARPGAPPRAVVDLGSGAGLPGLVLAERWGDARLLLVDAHRRRAAFLDHAVGALGLTSRVTVAAERAETLGRAPLLRGSFDLVAARGFGRPSVAAECGAPFLQVGGALVVSEPPGDAAAAGDAPAVGDAIAPGERWPAEGLAVLGMGSAQPVGSRFHFVLVAQERPCPERYPRRVGVPAKRPLF